MPPLILPDWMGVPPGIGAFSTERAGGVSGSPYGDGCGGRGLNFGTHTADDAQNVRQNRLLLRRMLPSEPVWLRQVHGNLVVDAGAVASNIVPAADASAMARTSSWRP